MPELLKISFTHSAVSDLEDIIEFYKKQSVPHVGERLVRKIFNDVELLSEQPDIGRIVRVWRSERLLILP